MSTVAWDGKIIAADKMAVNCGLERKKSKLFKHDNVVYAVTGELSEGLVLIQWHKDGADIEKYPKFQTPEDWTRLIVAEYGKITVYEAHPYPTEEEPFMAWGSGRDFAMGAMEMGAGAVRAIEIASKHSCGTGLGVDYFVVDGVPF